MQTPAAKPPGRFPGTLLVVDDEPKILRLMMEFFRARDMRVLLANSGEEALEALAQRPTAVLLDVNMPGMDGLMTLRKMKERQPNLSVIMVSAMGEEQTIQEAFALGAYDYVTKPFSLEYLETVVLTKILLGMDG
jgi:DNA-binding response OmpR family regulator